MSTNRWPPTYDSEQLQGVIQKLATDRTLSKKFYANQRAGGDICQGDIIALDADLPFLNSQGLVDATQTYTTWLVIGNTCDFSRAEVKTSQIVPVTLVPNEEINRDAFEGILTYRAARKFYLPPWMADDTFHGIANFANPATIEKGCLVGKVDARLSPTAWSLLHSCLIRFLCRDDGRFDD